MHPAFCASANAVLFPCFARIVQLVYCRLIRAQGFRLLLVLRDLHKKVGKLLARVEPVLIAAQLKFGVDILGDIEYTVTVTSGVGGYTGKYVLTGSFAGDFFYIRNVVK